MFRRPLHTRLAAGLVVAAALAAALTAAVAAHGSSSAPRRRAVTFAMFPNAQFAPCLNARGRTARVVGTLRRGKLNDTMTLHLSGFRRGLDFDLFTIQRSPQRRDGSPNPAFTGSFGLAWYQSDIHVGRRHRGTVTIHTILLNQIFGFDPDANLTPTATFHVGFWFNRPADAASCGFTGSTPFNGEHHAGPLAFVTRPRRSGLGPLCRHPDTHTSPVSCNP